LVTEITWPIYWDGALGKAKQDLDRAAHAIDADLKVTGGSANVAVLKSVSYASKCCNPCDASLHRDGISCE